jgi:tetratricopeptide (TPR) repeat protein
MTRVLRAAGLVLLGLLAAEAGRAAAPPVRGPVRLTAGQQWRIKVLQIQLNLAEARGQFEEAEKAARRIAALREQWQGKRHWETIDARLDVEQWQRLVRIPAKDRALVVRARRMNGEAARLQQRGRYRQAEKKFREALALGRGLLGEEHPHTATSRNNLAFCLNSQGRHGEALPLYREALKARRKVLGEGHADTAASYDNLAACLDDQGKPAQGQPLHEKALAIRRKVLGEQHPETAASYDNLAFCLNRQGKYGQALPLHQKALALRQKVLGQEHPDTADSWNNVAFCLDHQGRHAEALPLFHKALLLRQRVLGKEHPDIAGSYNNLASCLDDQGQHAQALPLLEKALSIRRKVLGEEHPATADSYNNLATCLQALGNHGQALSLFEKALLIDRKVLGEEHPRTATRRNNLALCLDEQGKHAQALPLFRQALATCRKVLGAGHPATARGCNNLALCLANQGRHADALPLFQEALAIRRQAQGELHPHTATTCNNLAFCLAEQGKWPKAVRLLQASLPGQEAARFHKASSGFDRALAARDVSPGALLAVGLARLRQPGNAFRHAEAALARGLLDDLAHGDPEDAGRLLTLSRRLHRLDEKFLSLFGQGPLTTDQQRLRDELTRQRRAVSAQLARLAAAVSARQVLPLADIQAALPANAALVLWLDQPRLRQHWACVLRRRGPPAWVELPGTGKGGPSGAIDLSLPARLYRTLHDPTSGAGQRDTLVAELRRQRLAPLRPYLQARGGMPAASRLFVVPTGYMAFIPMEVLAPEYRVSYVPSGSVLARLKQGQRPLQGSPLLAVGDPAFSAAGPQPSLVRRGTGHRRLPGTRLEVAGIARLVRPATVLLGSDASEQRLDQLRRAGQVQLVLCELEGQLAARLGEGGEVELPW